MFMVNVGKYSSPMDPMGNIKWKKISSPNVGKEYDIKTPVFNNSGSSFVGCQKSKLLPHFAKK